MSVLQVEALSVINITSDIKLVSNSSTITMMHGPINIRLKNVGNFMGYSEDRYTLLGAFVKQLRKPTVGFVVSFRLFARKSSAPT